MYPRYSYPPRLIAALARDWLLVQRRSFRRDSMACIARLSPPLRVLGGENIPAAGPCVLTFNHYYRPGFKAWWIALAIAAAVPVDIHFVMTGALTFPGRWYARLGESVSRFVLRRGARLYAFTTMPPMPPRVRDVQARAASVRAVLDFVQRTERPVIGLAPEGGDSPDGRLTRPPSGLGRFVSLLAARGLRVHPIGVYEEEGAFCLRFGPGYLPRVPPGLSADEKDRAVAGIVMENIARLLPPTLRGDFA